ncbi:MAG TPA: trehalose-phosphatase [Steroidobacteraceae bacterium]|jgi:trehalose 6-phosphate phosphatase|nr:trehalose-phosphatase [Steroidobacteraceae bacterium]
MMQLAPREAAAVHAVPLPTNAWCLFLDVDGTLLELADHPRAVSVDPELRRLIERLRAAAAGAVALVSGRTIADLDRLFDEPGLPLAGMHGCERRDARGALRVAPVALEQLAEVREGLQRMADRHPGLLFEDKGAGLALHFLKAPQLEHELRAEVALLAAPLVPRFTVLDGHAVLEVKPAAHTKDSAVSAFMEEEPFRGRQPIFIGDDQTDYGGFAAVRRFDGLAIAVGSRVKSDLWLPGPAAVRQWLENLAGSNLPAGPVNA